MDVVKKSHTMLSSLFSSSSGSSASASASGAASSASTSPLRYYDSFNSKLEEFISELMATFPELSDLRALKTSFTFAKTMNIRLPQQMFKAHVADKFGAKIMSNDEGFFLDYDYRDVIATAQNALGDDNAAIPPMGGVDIVGQLKSMWKDMSADNKDAVWRYLSVLIYLSGKCAA